MTKKQNLKLTIILLAISFAFVSCEKEKDDPRVETSSLTLTDDMYYYIKANILNKGDYAILDYGFEYTYAPSLPDAYYGSFQKKSLGKIISRDTFSCNLEFNNFNYYSGTIYFFTRAYITNEKGTVYGKMLSAESPKSTISGIVPNYAQIGDTVKIIGNNLAPSSTVNFNYISARVLSVTRSEVTVIVPSGLASEYYSYNISINIYSGSQSYSLSNAFTLEPTLSSFSPKTGSWSTSINIYGQYLNGSSIFFDDTFISNISSNSNIINVSVPSSFLKKQFKIYISKGGVKKEVPGGYFTMNNLSASFTPFLCYLPGTTLSILTTNANPNYNSNFLLLGNTKILNSNYSGSSLQFVIPPQIAEGEYSCKLSNYIDTILVTPKLKIVKPQITGLTLTSGYPNTSVTIQGKYFVNNGIAPSIYFDQTSTYASISSIDSSKIIFKTPWVTPGSYNIKVLFGSITVTASQQFTVLEPTLSSITPSSGAAGTSVIINGQGFGTTYTATVYFGNLSSTALSQTDSQINVKVPSELTSGTWLVKVRINGYELSSTTTFVVP